MHTKPNPLDGSRLMEMWRYGYECDFFAIYNLPRGSMPGGGLSWFENEAECAGLRAMMCEEMANRVEE